jgi:hypothetical protein
MYDELSTDKPEEHRESDDRRGFTPEEDIYNSTRYQLDRRIDDEFYE